MKKYGHLISQLRKKQGLTQGQLGEKLNVSYQAISKWENNLSEPDLETIEKMTEIFGISMSEFFSMAKNPEYVDNNTTIKETKQIKESKNFIKTKPWYLVVGLGVLVIILSLCAFLIPVKYSGKQILKKYESSIFYLSAESPYVSKSGTGFFINDKGFAVTIYDNIKDCTSGTVKLSNGKKYDIKQIVGIDEENNLAIIQIDIKKSTPIEFGNSNDVEMGNKVYSITHTTEDTLDDANSVLAEGVVYKVESDSKGTTSIQTSATTSKANKGGVLFNTRGKAIGIISNKLTVSGVGFDMVNVCKPIKLINKINKDINLSMSDYLKIQYGTYNVIFDGDGAIGEMQSQTLIRNFNYKIECDFAKTGYLFTGWSYNGINYGINIYNLGDVDTTITLTATWQEIEINIYYNLNGGYNNAGNIHELTYWQDNFTLLPATKKGHKFEGWYKDSNFTEPIDIIDTKIATNYTLYAKFILENYVINYELNEGTNSSLNPTSYTMNDGIINLEDAEKTGYTFAGWYKTSDFSGYSTSYISASSCESITLYAKFNINRYEIDYISNGGSLTIEIGYGYYTVEKFTRVSECRPSKAGYTFQGWYDNADFNGDKIEVVSYNRGYLGDIKLYAKYDVIYYTISYNLALGTINNDLNPTTYTVEDEVNFANPTKAGCNFYGWLDSNSYSYIKKINKGTTGNLSLKAVYRINEINGNVVITTNEALLEFISSGNVYKSKNVTLENDLDLSNVSSFYLNYSCSGFEGTFDGKNHTITNLKSALFSSTSDAIIKNVHIKNLETTRNAGLIVEASNCTITNCSVQGTIVSKTSSSGFSYCGGLIAEARSCTINRCSADINIKFNISSDDYSFTYIYIGGLVGEDYINGGNASYSTILNCYSTGNIEITERAYRDVYLKVGGLSATGNISNSYSTCDINIEMNFSNYDVKIGGLTATGKAIGSYATGNITTTFKDVSYLEEVKVASLSTAYSSNNTDILVDCYYYSGQSIETDAQIITNEISADMETIWAFIYENWDSNIWELALDSAPTLKKE